MPGGGLAASALNSSEIRLPLALLFDNDDRGLDDDLKLQFEAIKQLSAEDKQVIKDGTIVKLRTKQLSQLHT